MSDDIIMAKGLTKVFNKHLTAVDHVNFSVKQGEIFGSLGPNGARATKQETQMAIVNLINMPLMFASNTFFPISQMPEWMQAIAHVNPISYLTDAIRQLTMLQMDTSSLMPDFAYLSVSSRPCFLRSVWHCRGNTSRDSDSKQEERRSV